MALPDTFSLTTPATDWVRLETGKFIEEGTTIVQPWWLNIKSNARPQGISDFLIQSVLHQNSLVDGQPDDVLTVHMVVKGDLNRFSEAQIVSSANVVYNAFMDVGRRPKILRGER